jgi:hypothetical protein
MKKLSGPTVDRTNADRQRRYRERQKLKQNELSAAMEREKAQKIEIVNKTENQIIHLKKENERLIGLNKSLNEKLKFIKTLIEEIKLSLDASERAKLSLHMDARGLTDVLKST